MRLMTPTNLLSSVDAALPVFVIVDPMTGEPIPMEGTELTSAPFELREARARAWGRTVHPILLDDRIISIPPAMHPYLVEFSDLDDPWLQETLRIALKERAASHKDGLEGTGQSEHRIGGWLQSAANPEELAHDLANLMVLRVKTRVSARYLRLADRRVLAWVRHVVGDERLRAALPSGSCWHYLDENARLGSMHGSGCEAGPGLMFESSEWQRIASGPVHHGTIARWHGSWSDADQACFGSQSALNEAVWPLVEKAVVGAKRAAERHPDRFKDSHDITAWAALVMRHTEEGVELAIRSLDGLQDSGRADGLRMHLQCKAIDSAISNWSKR